MTPTPAELKAEILSGPRKGECAAPWTDGADAAVAGVLNDRGYGQTRPVPPALSLTVLAASGAFGQAAVVAVFNHARFPDFRAVVNAQDAAGAVAMAGLFAAGGTISAAEFAAFRDLAAKPVDAPCSAAEAKGWDSVQHLDIAAARKAGA